MARQGQARLAFKLVERVPGLALKGAKIVTDADGSVRLEATGAAPILVSRSEEAAAELGPALLVAGSATTPARIRITPDTDSTEGVVAFGLEPPVVLFGDSGIGFHCPSIILDDSEVAKGPGNGAPGVDPPKEQIAADEPAWRGLLARQIDFYLPPSVPLFGGRPITGYFAIPRGDGGVELIVDTKVPRREAQAGQAARAGYAIRIECIDPTAKGLSGLVPTLISASMELDLDGAEASPRSSGPINFAAGKPVRLTATFARDAVNAPGSMRVALAVSARGPDGIVSVRTDETATVTSPAKIFNTAALMATALIADGEVEEGEGGRLVLAALAAAGAALSALFEPDSQFVLHGAEIVSSGHGLPLGDKVALSLDYSVAARVVALGVPGGALSVQMNKDQPMRIRVRRVAMTLDLRKSGLEMIGLDYDRAEMEVENPGAWDITGIKQLFDVVGSRSGRGSSWIEVDLRFKLNLGPIRVSGMTIRGTLSNGTPEISITGIEAELDIPGAISGKGSLNLIPGGFHARLAASIVPLRLTADASLTYSETMIVLGLKVDLPAPMPLANSGLGLLGIGGLFAIGGMPFYGAGEADPVLRQLRWDPDAAGSFAPAAGRSTFGLEAAVGTFPDLGFTFSAKAGILITVPDVAVRGALNGRILQPAAKMSDAAYPPVPGISFLGFIGVDSNAASFAVIGSVNLKPLLEVRVPVSGYYPFNPSDDWYSYLGADGYPGQGREIGPISAKVLPDILDIGAEAYLMVRGKGVLGWPHGRHLPTGPINLTDGFVIAFGFSLRSQFGARPIAWAELHASLDILIGARPTTLAGCGRAGGSLNLGPFSLGVQAEVLFKSQSGATYLWAQVTGRIELLFFDVEGTVTISFGTDQKPTLPPPDRHPLDRYEDVDLGGGQREQRRVGTTAVLTDDSYRILTYLFENPADVTDERRIWPDAMIVLPFVFPPAINQATAGQQFPGVLGPGAPAAPKRIGSEMLRYKWRLDRVALVDVTDEPDAVEGLGTAVAAELAARWQVPHGKAGDVSELLLFSTSGDLWVNRRSDGGKELPDDPLGTNANLCNAHPKAMPAWAIGYLSGPLKGGGFRLPPDPVSMDPLISRVDARMHHFGLTIDFAERPLDLVHTLPQSFGLAPARIVTFDDSLDLGLGRPFMGAVVTPCVTWLPAFGLGPLLERGGFVAQRLHIDIDEPITDGVLVVIGDRRIFEPAERFEEFVVEDDLSRWTPDIVDLGTGQAAAVFRQSAEIAIAQVRVTWRIGAPLSIVGLRGMTFEAAATAAAEFAAIQDLVAVLDAAKQAGPKKHLRFGKHERAILAPERLYRLDVDLVWSGELYETGSTQPIKVETDKDTYEPVGGGDKRTRRRLFFGTAKKPSAAEKPIAGHLTYAAFLHDRQDVFEPEMIARYFAGYEPARSEQFQFCDDPIKAHFTQNHVVALAKAYEFELVTAVRRTDRPGDEHAAPSILEMVWAFATDPSFLGAADKIRYEDALLAGCAQPLPGATGTADAKLEPEAWYEVYVLAKSETFANGRLPGVSFRTSRWLSPEDMWAGLGFALDGPNSPEHASVTVGDLAISGLGLLRGVVEDDDLSYQNALAALGLEGWPVTAVPRLSRLWAPDGANGWLFAGLMIESPEPIHRPGRLTLDALSLALDGGAAAFNVRRRDRSGSRLVYVTDMPFAPAAGATLVFKATGKKGANPPKPVVGRLTLPIAPGFAGDP
ncbi:MAG: hypothetical protein AB7O56_02590 [Bauldia sp.]